MFEFQLNKPKLNVNAPTYLPKNVKPIDTNTLSFFNKEMTPFGFLQYPTQKGNTSNETSVSMIRFPIISNSPFAEEEVLNSKDDQDTFEINNQSVFERLCSSSIYRDSYPTLLKPLMNDFNVSSNNKSNLHKLVNNKQYNLSEMSFNANIIQVYKEKECILCLQLLTKGKKYGLLVNCEHVFCLECIKLWRKELLIAKKTEMYRKCPVCKAESFHVIPSEIFISDRVIKMNLAQEKKKRLSKIPCKYKTGTNKEECPFGSSCFYNHSIN